MQNYIEREILSDILHWLDRNKILLLKGSRQVGKTTLLKKIRRRLETEGKKTVYFSIDQELSNPVFQNSKNLFQFLKSQFSGISEKKKLYVFLDEFQYLPSPGIFLKTLFDESRDLFQIIVSGSSSLEITQNAEFLTGRKIEFHLYPFHFREFLSYKTGLKFPPPFHLKNFKKLKEFYTTYQAYLNEPLREFITFGGYPEVVTTDGFEDKTLLLKEIVQTYIEKDIIAFLGIENVTAFRNLLKILADQIGSLVNRSEISSTIHLSMETLKKYLEILEGTYVLDFVRPFFSNIRKELSKMPKVYLSDFGIRNVVLNKLSFREFISGSERENFIFQSLRSSYGIENIKFYRTISKAEIDFILEAPGGLIPIEVKSIQKKINPPKIMNNFRHEHQSPCVIVTDNFLHQTKHNYFIPTCLFPFVDFFG